MLKNWKIILLPLSLIYAIVIRIRHWLYDKKILKSNVYDIPIVKVGNLNLGGTGKTPHTEYIIALLLKNYKLAMLSRGYRRKTKGYKEAKKTSTARDIGDEALQIFRKFSRLKVVVDADRSRAVERIMQTKIEAIVMDDALQHRKLGGGLNVMLMDFNRPIDKDYLLPAGNLRDVRSRSAKMDVIIVSKCPEDLTKAEQLHYTNRLSPTPDQEIFFTDYRYLGLRSVFDNQNPLNDRFDNILLFTGIAKGKSLLEKADSMSRDVYHKSYPDHHTYTAEDMQKLIKIFNNFAVGDNILLTTEKDAVKLMNIDLPEEIKRMPIFYLPIRVNFLGRGSQFELLINEYVRKNKRNG